MRCSTLQIVCDRKYPKTTAHVVARVAAVAQIVNDYLH